MKWSQVVGFILLAHFVMLVMDRVTKGYAHNLFWISHLALLIAAIGFIYSSDLLTSGALVLVLIVHAFWIGDFIALVVNTISPLDYTSYWLDLTLYEKFLTIHHLYLLPLLLGWTVMQRKIHKKAWVVAGIVYASAVLFSLLFLPAYANINCAHEICQVAFNIFPMFEFLSYYPSGIQAIILVLIMGAGFFVVNNFLSNILREHFRKPKRSRRGYTR